MIVLEREGTGSFLTPLIVRAQWGDRRAFDAIFEEHHGYIRSLCIRLLGSEPEGEQIAQEVFLRALRYLPDFRGECPLRHWLSPMALQLCDNLVRTKKGSEAVRGRRLDDATIEAMLPPEPGVENEVVGKVYAQQLLALIRECEKTAKPRWDALDVMIFHLRFEQCMETAREVAQRLGRSENMVKYRLYNRINPVLDAARIRLQAEEKPL